MKKSKYTLTGDAAFDEMLDKHLGAISEALEKTAVSEDIAAVLLGGGYGRGEGGVFETSDGRKTLYNDLDFFVIAKNLSRSRLKKIDRALASLGKSFSRTIGIDVDFGPAKTLKQLAKMPFTMMWQELREGHQLIYGSEDVLNSLPDYDLHDLPRAEGLRLLLNRGTGLLLTKQAFARENITAADRDFIGRNLYKAVLACGDVFLLLQKQYCSSVNKRLCLVERLGKKKLDAEDMELYRLAVRFKLSPQIYSTQELLELQRVVMILFEKTCLYFFSVCYNLAINNLQELKHAFKGKDPFAQTVGNKEIMKNFILNVVYTGRLDYRFLFSTGNPRLKLLAVLLRLLFEYPYCRAYVNFIRYWNRIN